MYTIGNNRNVANTGGDGKLSKILHFYREAQYDTAVRGEIWRVGWDDFLKPRLGRYFVKKPVSRTHDTAVTGKYEE